MLFNSLDFIIFVALFFWGWPFLKKINNIRWGYLVIASFIFYGWWNWYYLFLLAVNGLIDFCVSLLIVKQRRYAKQWLIVSILANLGILFAYKYLDFVIQNTNWIFNAFGFDPVVGKMNLLLPVGISFYTFQSMSYTIDVYRGELKPTKNVLHYFAFLSMFPQLVAGPIVRARDILDQLNVARYVSEQDKFEGLKLIVFGYFKKVVCADNIARAVNDAFGGAMVYDGIYWWLIALMFAFQIYCDFSGYSDIACGLARWMGYSFKPNFNHPYISASFSEFWTRWHISLSSWFRDYVYIPLGGSKHGKLKMYRNIWITMMLSGLWHGAAWTYIIWGAWHSLFLSLEKMTGWSAKMSRVPGGKLLSVILVFMLTLIGWVFFRSDDFGQAISIIKCMIMPFGVENYTFYIKIFGYKAVAATLFILFSHIWYGLVIDKDSNGYDLINKMYVKNLIINRIYKFGQTAFVGFIMFCCVYFRGNAQEFIYFQF